MSLCTAVAGLSGNVATARAESWPSLDDLASPRFLLIAHCRVEEFQGRPLYKVLDVWKGEYSPQAFVKQPPTGYIDTAGPEGDASAREPGTEAILFYTRGNQPKGGIERHDMTIPVRPKDGALVYPPGYRGLLDAPGKIGTAYEFKRQIQSRIGKPAPKDRTNASSPPPASFAGQWRILLPLGFDQETTIEKLGENRFRLVSGASRFNGTYEQRGEELVAIEPAATRQEGYVWHARSLYMLTLVKQSDKLEQDYRGAVLFRPQAQVIQQAPRAANAHLSDEDLANRLLPHKIKRNRLNIEHHRGFYTLGSFDSLKKLWASLDDDKKLEGPVSDHLRKEQIDAVWILEVAISIVADLGDSKYPTLEDELLAYMGQDNSFLTGPLPEQRGGQPPPKYLSALFRTKTGEYGLITRYADFCVIELRGMLGAARLAPGAKASK
jgi:hypothetical protein